ncbi:MAG: quercetin 2,3-dioxygenase [Solirubrobacteraceae bacterium]
MQSYWFFDQLIDILVSGEQSGGSYSLAEVRGPQGFATPLHVHRDLDEGFYMIEGELTVWFGDQVSVLSAGDFAHAPRGVPHTIKNTGPGEARMLVMSTPAGFEDFVRAFGTPALTHEPPVLEGPPDVGRAAALAAENGIDLLGPPGMLPSDWSDAQPAA